MPPGLGGLALRPGGTPDPAVLAAMARALGLGGEAPYLAGPVALLGAGGAQPGPLVLVAQGAPDAEALRDAYRREGTGAGLPGCAFALHDRQERRLVLARDGFGIRALYLAAVPGGIAFATRPGALLAAGLVVPRLRQEARDELLQLHFTTGAETIFQGIARVLPGETVAIADGAVVERHRRPALPDGGPEQVSEAEAVARLDTALEAAMARALEGAARPGLLLAGGIEDAVLGTLLARPGGRRVPAFAACFDAGEAGGALRITEAKVWRHLPEIVAALDDPAADAAIVPLWFLARRARQEVDALLSGEGADEMLAGYGRYRSAARPWWLWGRRPRATGVFDHVRDVLRAPPSSWRDGIAAAEGAAAAPGRTRLMAAQAADIAEWLPNDVLLRLDRCLAAHGAEARLPFLDPAVAAACWRLPDALKIRGRSGKWLLRAWLARHGGAAAPVPRPGAAAPLAAWIAGVGERLGPLVAAQPGVAEVARPDRVAALFRHAAGGKHRGFAAWHLLFYALWHRAHVEGVPAEGDVWEVLGAR